MSVVLDAGAFIAFERGNRQVAGALRWVERSNEGSRSSAAVVAQVLRAPARQVALTRLLAGVDVRPLAQPDAGAIGQLLAQTPTNDVVDAHLAMLATDGDSVLTSDPNDLRTLLDARACRARVVPI